MNGESVFENGNEYMLSEDNKLCMKFGDRYVLVECDISAFIKMADRIGRNELWVKLCAISLQNKHNRVTAPDEDNSKLN